MQLRDQGCSGLSCTWSEALILVINLDSLRVEINTFEVERVTIQRRTVKTLKLAGHAQQCQPLSFTLQTACCPMACTYIHHNI